VPRIPARSSTGTWTELVGLLVVVMTRASAAMFVAALTKP
jgi:hypothetical protein